jgi:hypothetical protein
METREYFEKVMQDYNQNRNGRSLRNILASRWWQAAKPSGKDEAVDYNWLMEFKKTYSATKPVEQPQHSFISLSLEEETPKQMTWEVKMLQLQSPDGDSIEIKSNNLYAVAVYCYPN